MRTFKFKAVSVAISMALALALPFGVMAADGFGDGSAFDAAWDDANDFDNEWDDPDAFDFNEDETIESQVGDAFDFNEDETIESQVGDDFGFFSVDAFVAAEGETPESSDASEDGGIPGKDKPEYKFYYNVDGYEDLEVWYNGNKFVQKAYVYEPFVDPTCEEPRKFYMAINVGNDTILASEPVAFKVTDSRYQKPLGHQWEKVITIEGAAPEGCTSDDNCPCVTDVIITTKEYCPVCKKYKKVVGNQVTAVEEGEADFVEEKRTAPDHKYGEAATLYLDEDLKEFVEDENDPEKTWTYEVTYKLCQNEGCNHVWYEIKKAAEYDYTGYKNIADCSVLDDYEAVPPSEDLYNDIKLTNCTIDGIVKATVTTYKKEDVAFDTTDLLSEDSQDDTQQQVKDYSNLFTEPEGDASYILYTIPAHHTYKYLYTLKDKTLPNADKVANYVNILDVNGRSIVGDDIPADGLYDLNTSVGSSKYCVPFEVEVVKITVCENVQYHENKTQIAVSEGTVTAKATPGIHLYNDKLTTNVKDTANTKHVELATLKEEYNATTKKYTYKELTFAELKKLKKNTNIVVTTNVIDCTKAGNTGTATCKCSLCGELIAKTKVNFELAPEPKHTNVMEMTEVVPASCTETGSYIPVYTCDNCGIQSTGEKEIIPKTPHVYDGVSAAKVNVLGQIVVGSYWGDPQYNLGGTFDVIDVDGAVYVGAYGDATGQDMPTAKIYLTRTCTVCGQDIAVKNVKTLKATVTAVTKEGADGVYCKEGTITLKIEGAPQDGEKSLEAVTDEVTLRYYSSGDEYKARYAAHTPSEVVKSNEVDATETEVGGYDETITCVMCDKVISQRHVTIPALGHTHDMVAVEAKEATCTEAGNIAYYECQKCGLKYKTEAGELEDQLTDEEVVIPATRHTMELVEAKEPTCVPGHPAYYVCTTCTEMFNDVEGNEPVAWEDIKIEPTEEHTPAEPVVEQREDGVYSVVYCDRCGIEISAEPYKGETVELLAGPKTFNLKANKPNKGYMEFKLGEVEGAEKYRVSYRIAGTKPYTRQESDNHVVKITDLERGQVYDFTACAGDVLEDDQIQWGARALRKDGAVKYARRWYETVEQSKIAKKGTVITLEWTFLNDASKYEISIADNKAMDNAVTVDAAMFSPQIVGDKVQVSADITALPGFGSVPAGTQIKFYVRIRPYTMYDEKDVAGGVSNLRAKTIKF